MGYADENSTHDVPSRYFNYEVFGEDLLNDESYIELKSGKVVRLNY